MRNKKKRIEERGIFVTGLYVSTEYARGLYQTPFQMKKTLWYDELADPDPYFPSCPHLHSMDNRYKLNVYTGEIYSVSNKALVKDKKVKGKELERLWDEPSFRNFAERMRNLHIEKSPSLVLPKIPTFTSRKKRMLIKKLSLIKYGYKRFACNRGEKR